MGTKTWLNNEPFKEKPCPGCGETLRETRIKIGKKGIKAYRIWVHKETRKKDCYDKPINNSPYIKMPENHKEICQCGDCNRVRKWNQEIVMNKLEKGEFNSVKKPKGN